MFLGCLKGVSRTYVTEWSPVSGGDAFSSPTGGLVSELIGYSSTRSYRNDAWQATSDSSFFGQIAYQLVVVSVEEWHGFIHLFAVLGFRARSSSYNSECKGAIGTCRHYAFVLLSSYGVMCLCPTRIAAQPPMIRIVHLPGLCLGTSSRPRPAYVRQHHA